MVVEDVIPGEQIIEMRCFVGAVFIYRDNKHFRLRLSDEHAVGDEQGGALVAVLKWLRFGDPDEQFKSLFPRVGLGDGFINDPLQVSVIDWLRLMSSVLGVDADLLTISTVLARMQRTAAGDFCIHLPNVRGVDGRLAVVDNELRNVT